MVIFSPYFIVLALGLDVSLFYIFLFIPIVTIIEILPISILGLGSRDAAIILLFALIGINKENAFAISFLLLILKIIPVIILGFFVSWNKKIVLNINRTK